jgi:hypothetical protein
MQSIQERITKKAMLDAIDSLRLRAERQQPDTRELEAFVPLVPFSALSNANTQIVYGRNGTGKTHLLRAYHEHCETTFKTGSALPVYIDCRDLELGGGRSEVPLDDLILRFYRGFLEKAISRLKSFADTVITVGLLQKLFGGNAKERRKSIDASLEKLVCLLTEGMIEERLKEYVRTLKLGSDSSIQVKERFGVSAKVSAKGVKGAFVGEASSSSEDAETESEKIELVYRGLSVIDYQSIRSALENIIDMCGAGSIVLAG